jgi:glycosyltransferase involved in cell wall biosynthesis
VTLLFFSDISWEGLFQRPQQLALRLARRYPVLWIEPATLGRNVHWHADRVAENVHRVTIPQFPYHARNRFIRMLSYVLGSIALLRFVLVKTQQYLLRRTLRDLGVNAEETIALLQNFQYIRLVHHVRPAMLLFDYIDDAFGFTKFPSYVRNEWAETIRVANVVTVTAGALRDRIVAVVPREVYLINNGVEMAQFQRAAVERPADLPSPHRPIVIYVGAIARWMDFPLVRDICKVFPEVSFVLVGPVQPEVRETVDELRRAGNCHVLGTKPYAAIPGYLQHADVGMIPFVRNRLTSAVNPVKLYEYSAAGIPTVSTLFADDLQEFGDVVLLAGSREEFAEQIRRGLAMAHDRRLTEKLRTFAMANDWDSRAASMAGVIEQHIQTTDRR